ncbi:MAG TPA: right-handed parallel beta-helix repeat-containing protein [Actinomycetota bacterium]|nr:right-handed parallel beta-helix repeat-containing protein [Actinomycetota bacterium]
MAPHGVGRAGSPTKPAALALASALLVAALVGVPAPAGAATVEVAIGDNVFLPQVVHVEPGDTVRWVHRGFRTHTVTSDTGLFDSGDLHGGDAYSFTFTKEGVYVYHCRHHGAPGKVGQWGQVVVGTPDDGTDQEVIEVPGDFPTIQQAVDQARPGAHILVAPGTYREMVTVSTEGLVIRGGDRFRAVLQGDDRLETGFLVTADGVTIEDLTVRNFRRAGIAFRGVEGFAVLRVDLIKNRTYGVVATGSSEGVIRRSFGWGSGDSAFRVEDCFPCGVLLDRVTARTNVMGYAGQNATGVVILDSVFAGNGVGVVPSTLPGPAGLSGQGTLLLGNRLRANNDATVPVAGFAAQHGLLFGTGIWLLGSSNAVARGNRIAGHERYGVLVSAGVDPAVKPANNEVVGNTVTDSGLYALAWDGAGADNCFEGNEVTGPTGPSDLQVAFRCSARPFQGSAFAAVRDDVRQALASGPPPGQREPPEPRRPSCQRGRPGCHR